MRSLAEFGAEETLEDGVDDPNPSPLWRSASKELTILTSYIIRFIITSRLILKDKFFGIGAGFIFILWEKQKKDIQPQFIEKHQVTPGLYKHGS